MNTGKFRRTMSIAGALVLLGGLGLAIYPNVTATAAAGAGGPAGSVQYAIGPSLTTSMATITAAAMPSSVAARLETLHSRAAARQGPDDDDGASAVAASAAPIGGTVTTITGQTFTARISPERAADLAALAASSGLASWVAPTTRNGKAAYEVHVGAKVVYIDANTGLVLP